MSSKSNSKGPFKAPTLSSVEDQLKKRKILTETIQQVDLEKINNIADLLDAFGKASIQARNLGQVVEVYEQMLTDPKRVTVFLGIAGPLVAAGLRKVIRDMVAHGLVDVIVSTGAIIYQDIYQARGFKHYKGDPNADDGELHDLLIDRIYDTYTDDEKFWDTDAWIGKFADTLPEGNYSSRQFVNEIAKQLDDDNSILVTAARKGVPVFIPAMNDSSIGIGLTEHYVRKIKEGRKGVVIDSILDNYELTQIVVKSIQTGGAYIAGGVPKNFINDSVVMCYVFGKEAPGHAYAFQLTTDVPHWGGLSGSTLKEATAWGKISKKADKAMAFVEPSVSLPLVVGAVLQKGIAKNRPALALEWAGNELTRCEPADAGSKSKKELARAR